eukprot:jgi/Picsp_1/744/NSC_04233-R1_vacuolar protein sorting-associated protein 8 homolog
MDTEGLEEEEDLLSDVETEVGISEDEPCTQQTECRTEDGGNKNLGVIQNKGRDGWDTEQGLLGSDTDDSEVDSSAQSVSERYVEEEPGEKGDDLNISNIHHHIEKAAMTLEECMEYEENLVSNQVMSHQMDKDGELSLRALEDAAAKIVSKFDAIQRSPTEKGLGMEDEFRHESGASLGKHLVARCFLNPEFDFSVNRASSSDALYAMEEQPAEGMVSKAWSRGVPDVVCWYKGVVAVGDSVGLIRVLHPGKLPRQQRLHRLEDGSKASYDGVTAIDMVSHGSGLLLASGHKSGLLRLWECKMRNNDDTRKHQLAGNWSCLKQIHGCHGTSITSLRLLHAFSSLWLYSADSYGRLLSHNITRHLSLAAQALAGFTRQLTGHGAGSSNLITLKTAQGAVIDVGTVLVISGSPRGSDNFTTASESWTNDLFPYVLLSTTTCCIVCEIEHNGNLAARKVVNSDNISKNRYLSWRFEGAPTQKRVIMALAMDKSVEVFSVALETDQKKHQVSVTRLRTLFTPDKILGICFLGHSHVLATITEAGNGSSIRIQLCTEGVYSSGKEGEDLNTEEEVISIADWLVPRHLNIPAGFEVYNGASIEARDQILLLTSKGLRSVHLMSWQQRLGALVSQNRLPEALSHSMRLIFSFKGGMEESLAWPADTCVQSQFPELVNQVLAMVLAFVRKALIRLESSMPSAQNQIEIHRDDFVNSIDVAIDVCHFISRLDYFYDEVSPMVKKSDHKNSGCDPWGDLLEVLERKTLQSEIPARPPPDMIQNIVEYFVSKGDIERIERLILWLDVGSLDLNQLIPLCIKHQLLSAIIFIFSGAFHDYKSSGALIYAAASEDWVGRGTEKLNREGSCAPTYAAMKLLVYIQLCLQGKMYPPGKGLESPERQQEMKMQIIYLLFYANQSQLQEIIHLWDTVGGISKSRNLALFKDFPAPVIAFLCTVNPIDTLRIIQEGLSGWDALESDILSNEDEPGSVSGIRTVTQIAVDRVVELLDMDNINESNQISEDMEAKLGFISHHVASNRASIDGPIVISVLRYLARASKQGDETFDGLQKIFTEIVSHLEYPPTDEMLALATDAQFSSSKSKILHLKGEYEDALVSLVHDRKAKTSDKPFKYLRYILMDSNISEDRKAQFKSKAMSCMNNLVKLDADRSAEFVLDFMPSDQKEVVLLSLQNDPNSQFAFLQSLLKMLREQDTSLPTANGDSQDIPLSSWANFLSQKSTSSLYVRLLCRFKPDGVLEFLRKEDLYDLDDCLQYCSEYNLKRASAYLLERKGDIEGAFVMYTQDIDVINNKIMQLEVLSTTLLEHVQEARELAISMCARFSQDRQDAKISDNGIKDIWIRLLDTYIISLNNLHVGSHVLESRMESVFLECIEEVLTRASAFIPLSQFVEHLVESFQSTNVRGFQKVFSLLISISKAESNMMIDTANVASRDSVQLLNLCCQKLRKGCT